MSLRTYFKHLAGRAGKASHSKRGSNSHVNTKANKRAAHKAVRKDVMGRIDMPFRFIPNQEIDDEDR
jgi:hypothetical protein